MGQLLLISLRNLFQHRRRTLLLGSAIAFVTMLLVLLSSLFNGMQDTMLRSATTLMTGHVNIGGFYKITAGSAAPVVTNYAKIEQIVRREIKGLDNVVVRGRGFGKVISDTTSLQGAINGIDITHEKGFRDVVQVRSGRLEDLAQPRTALIFESQAERLEVKVGDMLTLSSPTFRGVQNTVDVRIVAIGGDLGFMSNFMIFVNSEAIRDLYQLDVTTAGALHLYLKDPEQADAVAAKLRKVLLAEGYGVMDKVAQPYFHKFDTVKREDWVGQKLDLTTWIDEMLFIRYTLQTLSVLIAILVTVLLVIIVIGVMNTLWMAVRERTREIGTLRAIGMQRGRILAMFVIETALLALGATLFGVLLATLLAAGVNAAEFVVPKGFQMFLMSDTLRLVVDVPTAVRSLLIISVITTLGSLEPAWRAARLQPVTAMHAN
ncbi:MAG: ABC transporter permease [Myxococcota bacterium]